MTKGQEKEIMSLKEKCTGIKNIKRIYNWLNRAGISAKDVKTVYTRYDHDTHQVWFGVVLFNGNEIMERPFSFFTAE